MHLQFSKLGCEELNDLDLSISETRRFDQLIEKLKIIESVKNELQEDSTTVSDVRALFDGIIDIFSSSKEKLSASYSIFRGPDFESTIIKVQARNQIALSRHERIANLSTIMARVEEDRSEVERGLSFAQQMLKRTQVYISGRSSTYIPLEFILPITNVVERLF